MFSCIFFFILTPNGFVPFIENYYGTSTAIGLKANAFIYIITEGYLKFLP